MECAYNNPSWSTRRPKGRTPYLCESESSGICCCMSNYYTDQVRQAETFSSIDPYRTTTLSSCSIFFT